MQLPNLYQRESEASTRIFFLNCLIFIFFFFQPPSFDKSFSGHLPFEAIKRKHKTFLRPVQKSWEQEKPVGNLTGIKPKPALDTYFTPSSYTQMVQMVYGYYEGYL